MSKGFRGEYQNNMDAKGRVILPVAFREIIGPKFVLAPSVDKNLDLYPLDEWEIREAKIEALGTSTIEARQLQRWIIGKSAIIEIDNQDRITIPQNLREKFELEKEIIFLGQSNHVEIWSKQNYEKSNENIDYSALARGLNF